MAREPSKKIIIGCDGTWLNSEYGFKQKSYLPWGNPLKGTLVTPSNVTRMCRALQPSPSSSGPPQIINYMPGVASAANFWDHFVNGATGMDIAENMREAYGAVQEKWAPGDEIYILGFSRGAFVARSVATMISDCGMLTKTGMEHFYDIFLDWQNANVKSWKSRMYPNLNLSLHQDQDGKPSEYAKQLEKDGWTRAGVWIKVVAVWDTVGALGVPTLGAFKPTRDFAFINTEVLPNVENCFQALALDEMRLPFSPTLWELPEERDNSCTLRQCWFPGCHADIGGSIDDMGVPNIALAWMAQQLSPFLDFDEDYLKFCHEVNMEYYAQSKPPEVRDWGMGYIYNPFTGIEILAGKADRTPGQYHATDYWTGKTLKRRLRHTNETVHPSVRVRIAGHGKGVADSPNYNPNALAKFKLVPPPGVTANQLDPMQEGYCWQYTDKQTGEVITLPEWKMDGLENMLYQISTKP